MLLGQKILFVQFDYLVHAVGWYWKLALEASKGLVVRMIAHDADVLPGAIA